MDESEKDLVNALLGDLREIGWAKAREKRSAGYMKDKPRKQWLIFLEDN